MKKIEFVLPDGGHSLPDYSLVEPYDNSEFETSGRPTVCMNWKYKDKSGYYEEDDYKKGISIGSILYIWAEGDYSCDCNRSLFFGLPEMKCGEKIKITKFWIEYREE